jgi:hypothetical protein
MLKQIVSSTIFASVLIFSPAFSAPTETLSFSTKDSVLFLYSGGKNIGRFSNVLVSNAAMLSSVENSTTGTPLIKIVTDGSRNKYNVTIPIIEIDGVPYTNCAYKSVFDSNDESRSVGVSCSLTPLRQFDPESAVSEKGLIKYRTEFNWLRDAVAKNCTTPIGIEYGSYRIALCAKEGDPDPSGESTIVFDKKGKIIFSVRGYELIPGGISGGEFAFVGVSGEQTNFHINNLDCMTPPRVSERDRSQTGKIGKYGIKYSSYKIGNCAYGSYSYQNKTEQISLSGVVSEDSLRLLEITNDKEVTGIFNLNPNMADFNGSWISVPSGKLFRVR